MPLSEGASAEAALRVGRRIAAELRTHRGDFLAQSRRVTDRNRHGCGRSKLTERAYVRCHDWDTARKRFRDNKAKALPPRRRDDKVAGVVHGCHVAAVTKPPGVRVL